MFYLHTGNGGERSLYRVYISIHKARIHTGDADQSTCGGGLFFVFAAITALRIVWRRGVFLLFFWSFSSSRCVKRYRLNSCPCTHVHEQIGRGRPRAGCRVLSPFVVHQLLSIKMNG